MVILSTTALQRGNLGLKVQIIPRNYSLNIHNIGKKNHY